MTFFFQSVNSENTPDIYVKLALMNQTKEVKRKKTQIIKKNINPAFQESFNFKADENDIETIGVRVTAMQHMPFPEKGRNIFYRLIIMFYSLFAIIQSTFFRLIRRTALPKENIYML